MTEKQNIILCGFMGCGKSTVGPLLAGMSGRKFVDMDSYIEQHAGKTVSAIFAEDGEPHFRALEREACAVLAAQSGLVIAAGGGTLVQQGNADILRKTGVIVLLDASLDTLQKRLAHDTTRPLLQKPNRAAVIAELLSQRLPLYRNAADFAGILLFPANQKTIAKFLVDKQGKAGYDKNDFKIGSSLRS